MFNGALITPRNVAIILVIAIVWLYGGKIFAKKHVENEE